MTKVVQEKRIPHIMVNTPFDSDESDARGVAECIIRDRLGIKSFEIVLVELDAEGLIQISGGVMHGKRFRVAFRQTHGEVVYIHPDYDRHVQK